MGSRLAGVQAIALSLNKIDVLRDERPLRGDAAFEAFEFLVNRVQPRDHVREHLQMFFGGQSAGDSTIASKGIDKSRSLYIVWSSSQVLRSERTHFVWNNVDHAKRVGMHG